MINKRTLIDVLMAMFLVILFLYNFTGNFLHEYIGLCLFVLFVYHLILNFRKVKFFLKTKFDFGKIILVAIAISCVFTFTSAIFLSQEIFILKLFEDGILVRKIHTASAYWLLLICSLHFGINIKKIPLFRKMISYLKKNRFLELTSKIFLTLFCIFAVINIFGINLFAKLTAFYTFSFQETETTVFKHIFEYLSVVIFFSYLGFLSTNLKKLKRQNYKYKK